MAPKITVKIRDYDRGFDAFARNARAAQRGTLRVGVQPRDAARPYRSGATVGDVAAWHEAGGPRMPARPFLSYWFRRRGAVYMNAITDAVQLNLTRGNIQASLRDLGLRAVAEVRAGMRALAPLARSTVERKGSPAVLRETGLLERSISALVEVKRATAGVVSRLTR